jgi:predicted aspartyl protease
MSTDAAGVRKHLPPCDWDVVVYYDPPAKQHLSLKSLGTDILTVKAGIGRTSIRLLLDTGASKCFISRKRESDLGLLIRPYNQDMVVITGDGHEASITGFTTAQVHIGSFKAKVTFLVTDLAPRIRRCLGV